MSLSKALRRIVDNVEATENRIEALSFLVKQVREALETEACSLFLFDPQHDEYLLAVSDGYNDKYLKNLRLAAGKGLVSLVAEQEKALNLADASTHERYHLVPNSGEEKYRAFLGVPIINNRQVLGVLIVEQQIVGCYPEESEAFLLTLASQISNYLARQQSLGLLTACLELRQQNDALLPGRSGSAGVGIGAAVAVYPVADFDTVPERTTEAITDEITILNDAIKSTRIEIETIHQQLSPSLPSSEQDLFIAYLRMLDSNSLGKEIVDEIKQGWWAQTALKNVVEKRTQQFESMDDPYLRERAADIRSLGQRVLAHMQQQKHTSVQFPDHTILIADELSAADLARVPLEKLAGLVSSQGSSYSHVAILARALGVPAVVGVMSLPLAKLDGQPMIVDGYYGQVYINPSQALLHDFQVLAEQERQLDDNLEQLRDLPTETIDGQRILLQVNAGLDVDTGTMLSSCAEGVGLFRTELPFMQRDTFPSEQEQYTIYKQILHSFAPRPVALRTLDVGGDKPLSYFPINEDNPFLGWRGLRISLERSDIFLAQVRAMLRASDGLNNLSILLPMVTSVTEVDEAKQLIQQAFDEVSAELSVMMPKIGCMIEVPSAVYQARLIAKKVDYLSVGSNDLTQYLLAVDRNNAKVADLYDCFHPAVLQALQDVVHAARLEGKPVSICGEMASDPLAIFLLIAIGYTSFSVNASNLLRIKWVIRRCSIKRARKMLQEVMQLDNAKAIRLKLSNILESAGLGGLIRAGN